MGAEADSAKVEKLLSELAGKSVADVIADGSKKLASVPSGGAAPAAGGAAAAAAPAAGGAPAKEDKKKEEKKEEEEEEVRQDQVLGIESQPPCTAKRH